MKANGATPVSYGYDAASRLIQVAQAGLVVGLGYDNANRRTSLTYPNGTNTSYAYDVASRLTSITHNGPAGLIESLAYTHDAAGNRISLTRTNGTASNLPQAVQAAYDAANEQITFNSLPATFDANGNQTTSTDASGTTTYTWDARNRLVSQTGPGVNATFQYDALGRRISKTINSVATSYLYDGNDIVQEIGGSAVGASYVRSLNIDEPFVRQMASGNEFYHTDALGSSLALSNAAGSSTVSYSYEAYGKTTMTGTSSNSLQYTGRENDGTELYYYRTRYFNPKLQRFIREDALGIIGGLNVYDYVGNDPANQTDPLGLYGIAGAVGGAIVNASAQIIANYIQTGDLSRSLRCVNLIDVGISGLAGALGPTFLGQVVLGKPGPFAIPAYAQRIIYAQVILPLGVATKIAAPDYRIGDKCECGNLTWGNLAGQLLQ